MIGHNDQRTGNIFIKLYLNYFRSMCTLFEISNMNKQVKYCRIYSKQNVNLTALNFNFR